MSESQNNMPDFSSAAWRTSVSVSLATIEARVAQMATDSIGIRTTMRRVESDLKADDRETNRRLEEHFKADAENFEKVAAKIDDIKTKVLMLVGGIIGVEAVIMLALQIYQAMK